MSRKGGIAKLGFMRVWILGLIFFTTLIGLSFATLPNSEKPIAPLQADSTVLSILERSCYDCHSVVGQTPWYGYVFPVSLYLAHHREEGRNELNFSNWGNYSEKKKSNLRASILEEIEEGEMPLPEYLWFHKEAKLSQADLDALKKWAETSEKENE